MRDILFRGKRVDTGQWSYGSLIILSDKTMITEESGSNNPLGEHTYKSNIVDIETVGQWSGMLDKGGKRMFEGDIVMETDEEWDEIISRVVFKLGTFSLEEKGCEDQIMPLCDYLERKEIIGNVHDNPEILGRRGV